MCTMQTKNKDVALAAIWQRSRLTSLLLTIKWIWSARHRNFFMAPKPINFGRTIFGQQSCLGLALTLERGTAIWKQGQHRGLNGITLYRRIQQLNSVTIYILLCCVYVGYMFYYVTISYWLHLLWHFLLYPYGSFLHTDLVWVFFPFC